jgi:UDP-N-acetylglucosamine--N-acetylmuramyl-(pentapeptide) pyrophosphoryl-undecaprenol N-acetylglucosamine transferase
MEAGIVHGESSLPFVGIPAAALRGRGPLGLLRNTLTLLKGTLAARQQIVQLRPAAILGTGGYVCVPVFLAAWLMRVPTVIYLPDVVPGLAVRFLARLAKVLACSVEDSAAVIRHAALRVTGYPVRPELFTIDRVVCRAAFGVTPDLPVLLVTGGSRGARSINQAIAALLPQLLPICQIIHICGREGDQQFLRTAAEALPAELQARYRLYPYLPSATEQIPATMVEAFGAADLILCRSGASTLGELPAVGLPAILVPYPYVHQEENADYLVRHGTAQKVLDGEMLGDGQPEQGSLFRQLRHLIVESSERVSMAQRSHSLARPDAARRLAEIVLALAVERRAA